MSNEKIELDKNDNMFSKFLGTTIFNKIFIALGIIVIIIYFGFYIIKQPIVDEEIVVMKNFEPWIVKKGDSFVKAFFERPFDLKITELGQYRPRYLAFLVQFLDENLFVVITRLIPFFGNRQPFYIVAAFLSVFSIYYFLKSVCKSIPKELSFFISTSILLFQNYQVATYWRARSAKLLAVSATVFLIAFVFKRLDIEFKKKDYKKLLMSIPIFILMTLDEQVLALTVFLTLLTILFCIINKKISLISIIMSISCFIYGTYHLFWGKAIFQHFTGGLKKHGHTIAGSIQGISFSTFFESLKILKNVIPKIIFLSFILFFFVWIGLFLNYIFKTKEKEKIEKIKKIILTLFLSFTSVVLLMLMIDAHPAIYTTKSLWASVYIIIPCLILFLSLMYLFEISDLKNFNYIKQYVLIIGISVPMVYNISNINKYYYGAYLDVKGGFLNFVGDIIVTKKDIKIAGTNTKEYNIDNDNLTAILNTPFSTGNIKSTKILKGYKDNKIYNKFEGYFITKENRKLNLDLNVKNIGKNENIVLYVNNDKTIINLDNESIKKSISVSTERNRACKVKILIRGTNKYLKVNKLYMK